MLILFREKSLRSLAGLTTKSDCRVSLARRNGAFTFGTSAKQPRSSSKPSTRVWLNWNTRKTEMLVGGRKNTSPATCKTTIERQTKAEKTARDVGSPATGRHSTTARTTRNALSSPLLSALAARTPLRASTRASNRTLPILTWMRCPRFQTVATDSFPVALVALTRENVIFVWASKVWKQWVFHWRLRMECQKPWTKLTMEKPCRVNHYKVVVSSCVIVLLLISYDV